MSYSSGDEAFYFRDVAESKPYLFVSDSFILHLLPFDVENSSDGIVVEAFKLFFIFGR